MIVAASTTCFADSPLPKAVAQLESLGFTSVSIVIGDSSVQLTPDQLVSDPEAARRLCRDTHRLNIVAYQLDVEEGAPQYYEKFTAVCRLAKSTKVVNVVAPSSKLGIPFNEEVERLRKLVAIAKLEGTRISIRTEAGRLSEDPDTLTVLCDNVEGLGVALDPSYFIYGPPRSTNYDKILKYVHHVLLRDTSKSAFQVRVGQGLIDYGRLINQLRRHQYDRALCVDIVPTPDTDHAGELRKLHLLLESLL